MYVCTRLFVCDCAVIYTILCNCGILCARFSFVVSPLNTCWVLRWSALVFLIIMSVSLFLSVYVCVRVWICMTVFKFVYIRVRHPSYRRAIPSIFL